MQVFMQVMMFDYYILLHSLFSLNMRTIPSIWKYKIQYTNQDDMGLGIEAQWFFVLVKICLVSSISLSIS